LSVFGKTEFNIEYMARMLNTRKNAGGPATVLFLGSRTSSLFRRPALADLLKGFSNRDILSMTSVERFQGCHQILEEEFRKQNKDRDIHFIIRTALKEKQVEAADLCVAELMKQGFFDLIITTNIGSELERAFHQCGMEDPYDFEVVIPGSGGFIASKIEKGFAFQMLKASGDFASKRYSVYGYNIDSKKTFLDTYPELKTSLEQVKEEEMLMVGFDHKWDKHLIDAIFRRRTGSLWYINEEQTTEDSLLFPYLQDCEAKRFEDATGEYGPFFVNLCNKLGIVPTNEMTPHKLTSKDKVLHEVQNMQYTLQNGLDHLTETVDKLYQSQEATMKDIKEDIVGLRTDVDILLTRSTPNSPSDSTSFPSGDTFFADLQGKNRDTLEHQSSEEN
jgi:hypothetical protein